MKTAKRFYQLSSGVIYATSFIILGILTITNLRFSTYVVSIREQVSVKNTNLFMTGVFLLGIFLILYLVFRYADKINEKKLFMICSIIYLILGIYLIVNINSVLRYDAMSVHNASLAMHRGDFSTMDTGHYTYRYPHQLGFLIYEYILGFISHDAKLIFVINLVFILLINFFLYKITKEIFHDQHKVNLITIILSFMFFPQFFFLTFAYGLIPGFCLLTIGIYYLLVAVRTKERKYRILSSIFLMLAVLMKKNFIIALAACVCYLFWMYLKDHDRKILKFIALLCIVFVAGKAVMTAGFEIYTGKKVNQGVPSILWVAMGTDPDNHRRSGGWYDRKYVSVYQQNHYDRKRSDQIGKKMVSGYFKYYKAHPDKAYEFFGKKITTTWADPLYESIFSGPKKEAGQHVKTKQLYRIFNHEEKNKELYSGMKAYIILLFAAVWVFLIKYLKEYDAAALGLIFLVGGFLFHLFWETKGQYVYPYIFMQIPAGAYALTKLLDKMTRQKI